MSRISTRLAAAVLGAALANAQRGEPIEAKSKPAIDPFEAFFNAAPAPTRRPVKYVGGKSRESKTKRAMRKDSKRRNR